MDLIYLVSSILTVLAAIAGLILVCYLEKRMLKSRRGRSADAADGPTPGDGLAT